MSIIDQFRLDGKTALITGCKRGIGKAMAVALAEAGADIIGVSTTLEKEGSEVEKEVVARGQQFTAFRCDLSNRKALYDFIQKVKADFRQIDILVNNAGTTHRQASTEFPDDQWDRVIEVNQSAPFILTREFGKDMVARGNGKVVFTASLLTFQGGITVPAYAASKGAIGLMTKAFANEWASSGVNVNAIAPGYIRTDMTHDLQNNPERAPTISGRIPAGRWGQPKDFAGPVVFLCSEASAYMHGTVMLVDGGWMGR